MSTINPQPRPRRPLAPPEERRQAVEVAHFVTALEQPAGRVNMLGALALVGALFPGIRLDTALAGYVFRRLLAKPQRVLQ